MYRFYCNAIHSASNLPSHARQRVMARILHNVQTLKHFNAYQRMQLTIEACKQVHYLEKLK